MLVVHQPGARPRIGLHAVAAHHGAGGLCKGGKGNARGEGSLVCKTLIPLPLFQTSVVKAFCSASYALPQLIPHIPPPTHLLVEDPLRVVPQHRLRLESHHVAEEAMVCSVKQAHACHIHAGRADAAQTYRGRGGG